MNLKTAQDIHKVGIESSEKRKNDQDIKESDIQWFRNWFAEEQKELLETLESRHVHREKLFEIETIVFADRYMDEEELQEVPESIKRLEMKTVKKILKDIVSPLGYRVSDLGALCYEPEMKWFQNGREAGCLCRYLRIKPKKTFKQKIFGY